MASICRSAHPAGDPTRRAARTSLDDFLATAMLARGVPLLLLPDLAWPGCVCAEDRDSGADDLAG